MCNELRSRYRFAFALGVSRGHEVRRNHKPERFRANAWAVGDDEIAKTQERLVLLPHGNVEESVGTDDEENTIAGIGVTEIANRIDRVVKLGAGKIFACLGERRNKMRMIHASEGNHCETVRERCEVLLQFVRRTAGGDEMDFIEIEPAVSSAGYGEMAIVNWVERAAKNRDAAGMMLCGSAVRLRGGQFVSNRASKIILA